MPSLDPGLQVGERVGREFTFGTDLPLSPGPERRGNAFSPQPRAQRLSFPVLGSAFPRTFAAGLFIQPHPSALQDGLEEQPRTSSHWRIWKSSPSASRQHQVTLTSAQSICTQLPGVDFCWTQGGFLRKRQICLGADLGIDSSSWTVTAWSLGARLSWSLDNLQARRSQLGYHRVSVSLCPHLHSHYFKALSFPPASYPATCPHSWQLP